MASSPQAKFQKQRGDVVHQGWLEKKGQRWKNWKVRYCVLYEDKTLTYSNSPKETPIATIDLGTAMKILSATGGAKTYRIEIATPVRTWEFAADTAVVRDKWLRHLNQINRVQAIKPRKEGVLLKQDSANSWKWYYFAVFEGLLCYFPGADECKHFKEAVAKTARYSECLRFCKGYIVLKAASIKRLDPIDNQEYVFEVASGKSKYTICGSGEDETAEWFELLQRQTKKDPPRGVRPKSLLKSPRKLDAERKSEPLPLDSRKSPSRASRRFRRAFPKRANTDLPSTHRTTPSRIGTAAGNTPSTLPPKAFQKKRRPEVARAADDANVNYGRKQHGHNRSLSQPLVMNEEQQRTRPPPRKNIRASVVFGLKSGVNTFTSGASSLFGGIAGGASSLFQSPVKGASPRRPTPLQIGPELKDDSAQDPSQPGAAAAAAPPPPQNNGTPRSENSSEGHQRPRPKLKPAHSLPINLKADIHQFQLQEYADLFFRTHQKKKMYIFNRQVVPVKDLLKHQYDDLEHSLLELKSADNNDAVKNFKNIIKFMDVEFIGSRQNVATSILTLGEQNPHIRDEILCQICKQLTANPSIESEMLGWRLLTMCLSSWPPTRSFEAYLHKFLQNYSINNSMQTVLVLSGYCVWCLNCAIHDRHDTTPLTLTDVNDMLENSVPSYRVSFFSSIPFIMNCQRRNVNREEIPIVLKHLSEAVIDLGGRETVGIFRIAANVREVKQLRAQIQEGNFEMKHFSPDVPADVLKQWLRDMAISLIPSEHFDECIKSSKNSPEECIQLIREKLHPDHVKILEYLSKFFADLAQYSDVTSMGSSNLALVIAPNILRDDSADPETLFSNSKASQKFITNLILAFKDEVTRNDAEDQNEEEKETAEA